MEWKFRKISLKAEDRSFLDKLSWGIRQSRDSSDMILKITSQRDEVKRRERGLDSKGHLGIGTNWIFDYSGHKL